MNCQNENLYHVYNQGNNRRQIFFIDENYLFFLKKIRAFLLPHADFLAYSLMPNHFHFLIYMHSVDAPIPPPHLTNFRYKQIPQKLQKESDSSPKIRNFSESIAIMLRSYTRAINKQEGNSGSLFREKTKAKNGFDGKLWTGEKSITKDFSFAEGNDYATNCFHYIHENAKEANLVTKPEDYMYSSARDYAGLRKGTLCNQELAKKLLFI